MGSNGLHVTPLRNVTRNIISFNQLHYCGEMCNSIALTCRIIHDYDLNYISSVFLQRQKFDTILTLLIGSPVEFEIAAPSTSLWSKVWAISTTPMTIKNEFQCRKRRQFLCADIRSHSKNNYRSLTLLWLLFFVVVLSTAGSFYTAGSTFIQNLEK